MTDVAKNECLAGSGLSMEGINFGWFAIWFLSSAWLRRNMEVCDFCQALTWSRRAWERGVRAVPHLCGLYPSMCLTTEEKSRKNLSQGSRSVPAGTMKMHKHTKRIQHKYTIRIHRHNNKKYINYSIKQEYNHIYIDKKMEPREYERMW